MRTPRPRPLDARPSPRHGQRFQLLPAAAVALALVPAAARPADWAVGAEGGYFGVNASKSAKAVFGGSSGGGSFGGFLHFGLGPRFFVEAHGRYFSKTGQRVFVADNASPVFPLGHPLTIRTVPVYGEVGYRFITGARWAPYVAAGAGATSY